MTTAGILRWAVGLLAAVTGADTWFVQAFQNRILARPGDSGKPTPEGAHRDGVDYVLTVLVDRCRIDGGVSVLYFLDEDEPVTETLLEERGDFLLNDDRTMASRSQSDRDQ